MGKAGFGTSLYFAARTVGTLAGAILLARFSIMRFFKISIFLAIVAMVAMIFSSGSLVVLVAVALIGLAIANVFSIIFSIALRYKPELGNEISGLMIMGVAGGAVIPLIMGMLTDVLNGLHVGGMLVLLAVLFYLLYVSYKIRNV